MHHISRAHLPMATHTHGFGHHGFARQVSDRNFDDVLKSARTDSPQKSSEISEDMKTEEAEETEGAQQAEDVLTSMSPEDFKNMRLLAAEMGIKPEDTYKFEELINSLLKGGMINSQDLADAIKVNPQDSGWGWSVSPEDLEAAKAKESTPVRNVLEDLWDKIKDEKNVEAADLPQKFEKSAAEKHFVPRGFHFAGHFAGPHLHKIRVHDFGPHHHGMRNFSPHRFMHAHPHCCSANFSGVRFFANAVNVRGFQGHPFANVRGAIYFPKVHHIDHFKVNMDLATGKFAALASSGEEVTEKSPVYKLLEDIMKNLYQKLANFSNTNSPSNSATQDNNTSAELSQQLEQDEMLKKLFLLLSQSDTNTTEA